MVVLVLLVEGTDLGLQVVLEHLVGIDLVVLVEGIDLVVLVVLVEGIGLAVLVGGIVPVVLAVLVLLVGGTVLERLVVEIDPVGLAVLVEGIALEEELDLVVEDIVLVRPVEVLGLVVGTVVVLELETDLGLLAELVFEVKVGLVGTDLVVAEVAQVELAGSWEGQWG